MSLKSFNAPTIFGRRQWQNLAVLQTLQMTKIVELEELLYSMVEAQLEELHHMGHRFITSPENPTTLH
jgi:hypothetical protein